MGSSKRHRGSTVTQVLPELARHKGWQTKLEQHSFFPEWEKVVGDYVAGCSRPLKVVKNVLWLEVENSTWMQQLQFEKARILEDVNGRLSRAKIKDIKFLLAGPKEEAKKYHVPEITFVSPDPEALRRFEEQVSCIADDDTREAIVRLWYLHKACRRKKNK